MLLDIRDLSMDEFMRGGVNATISHKNPRGEKKRKLKSIWTRRDRVNLAIGEDMGTEAITILMEKVIVGN